MTENGDGPPGRDPAERQLWLMTLVRLAGFAIVLLGMWVIGQFQGRGPAMLGGLCLMGGGAALLLFGPRALARRLKP
jgi:hypothetical protein